jgi:hypothetical protein
MWEQRYNRRISVAWEQYTSYVRRENDSLRSVYVLGYQNTLTADSNRVRNKRLSISFWTCCYLNPDFLAMGCYPTQDVLPTVLHKRKRKANPVTASEGPTGCETSRLPHFLGSLHTTVRLSALRAGRPLTPGKFLVLISVRGWVDSRAIVRLGGLGQLKKIQWPHRESHPRPSGL